MHKPELGFGIMRVQNEDGVIDYASVGTALDEYMKGEFCYFDVHPSYVLGMSQAVLKKYIVDRHPRDSYMVANKMPYFGINSPKDYERIFEEELFECGVEYFDNYLLHAISIDVY